MFRAPCVHRQEVKIVLYSLWYHHTETSDWTKITKIAYLLTPWCRVLLEKLTGLQLVKKITKITKIYKYEHIVVKFMCEFFGCDYCVLLTINML